MPQPLLERSIGNKNKEGVSSQLADPDQGGGGWGSIPKAREKNGPYYRETFFRGEGPNIKLLGRPEQVLGGGSSKVRKN